MSIRVTGAPALANIIADILEAYLGTNHQTGVSYVRPVGLAMHGNNALGPGVEIRTIDGRAYHVAIIEQYATRPRPLTDP